jgi:hypothetical protein
LKILFNEHRAFDASLGVIERPRYGPQSFPMVDETTAVIVRKVFVDIVVWLLPD